MPLIKFTLIYVLFFGLSLLAHEHFKDYCFEQHRELTDKEYLTIAFNDLLKSGDIKIHDWDSTLDTYLHHHPGCCRMSKKYDLGPWSTEVTVMIIYERSDEDKEKVYGVDYTHYESLIMMTNCGRVYDHTGEALPTQTTGFYQQKI